MVGKANGWFDKAMGPTVKIQWTSFNAGPSAIEALFAGAIDMTYVGPNPAINGYVRSNGEALRVVAGAASGGPDVQSISLPRVAEFYKVMFQIAQAVYALLPGTGCRRCSRSM